MRSGSIVVATLLTACGASNELGSPNLVDAPSGTPQCFSSSECPVGFVCSEFGTCVAPPPPPPDGPGVPPPEVEYRLSEPINSRHFVWVAMTDQDRLAKIDGANLAIESLAVGDQPKVMATLPGTDTAVVLDSKNAAATVVRAQTGSVQTDLYPTLPNLNRLAVAPGGRHAIAFFDLNKAISRSTIASPTSMVTASTRCSSSRPSTTARRTTSRSASWPSAKPS